MTKVKDPISILKILVENGYRVDGKGNWRYNGEANFTPEMWQFCGKEPSDLWTWQPEWLEEAITLEDLVQDQPILVKDFPEDEWVKRHFAFSKHGRVSVYSEGRTSYTSKGTSGWNIWKLPDEETK